MTLQHSIENSRAEKIGANGIGKAALDETLGRSEAALAFVRDAHDSRKLPLLRMPARTDDLAEIESIAARLRAGATDVVILGTGGSSLGGQTLAQLGGWGIPADDGNGGQRDRPRTRFYDNLDACTLERALQNLDLATTRFVVISKSGNTPETLVQTIAAVEAVRAAGLRDRIPELFLGLTEPRSTATNGLRDLCEAVRAFPAPVIARMPGWCLGGGLEVAAAGDVRIAAHDARFGMPEVRVGIPSVIHAALLPRLIGWGRARWLVMTAEHIDAPTALTWGLVDVVAPEGGLDEAIERTVQALLECGPEALRAQKALLRQWEELPLKQSVDLSIGVFGQSFLTDEPKRLMQGFINRKR